MELLGQVQGWSLQDGHLTRTFTFPDAATCIAFIAEIGGFATGEGHFPDLCMKEGRYVEVSFYTYPAGGLTLNDFIMAAKLNEMSSAVITASSILFRNPKGFRGLRRNNNE